MAKSKSALRKIPTFKSEEDEREFWETADSTRYIDWSKAEVVRFPEFASVNHGDLPFGCRTHWLTELKLLANERDVPYQSLLKVYLADRVSAERERKRRRAAG